MFKVTEFADNFLRNLYIQGLIQGNITEEQARKVDALLKSKLKSSPLKSTDVTDIRCNGIPEGAWTVRVDSLDAGDSNTLVTNYYQTGPGTIRDHAILETIVLLMEEPIFDTLRTQEQLGYAVSMCLRNTYGVFGISVTVNTQATKFTAQHVDKRIEAFFENFIKEQLTEEAVKEAADSLVKLKVKYNVNNKQILN